MLLNNFKRLKKYIDLWGIDFKKIKQIFDQLFFNKKENFINNLDIGIAIDLSK
jgi:hypothetical protein